jgi:aminopeptidase N
LLGKIYHEKSEEEWIFQYEHCDRYRGRAVAIDKLFAQKENAPNNYNPFSEKAKIDVLIKALEDPFWVIRETALEQFSRYVVPSPETFTVKLEKIALNDPKPSVKARAITLLASYDLQKYIYIYEKGLKERPYSVVSASLAAYLKSNVPDKEAVIAEFERSDNADIIMTLADYYLYSKNPNKYEWLKAKLLSKTGRDLYYLLGYFGEYTRLMKGEQREDGKKVIQQIADNDKHEWIKQIAKKYIKEL